MISEACISKSIADIATKIGREIDHGLLFPVIILVCTSTHAFLRIFVYGDSGTVSECIFFTHPVSINTQFEGKVGYDSTCHRNFCNPYEM